MNPTFIGPMELVWQSRRVRGEGVMALSPLGAAIFRPARALLHDSPKNCYSTIYVTKL